MKPGDEITGIDIEKYIPHRGLNLLVDRIEFYESGGKLMNRSQLRIPADGTDARDIFLVKDRGEWVYSDFFLVEHVALTSAVQISVHRSDSDIAFFSTITNFKSSGPIPAGETVVADVEPLGKRGPFHRSSCVVRSGSADGPVLLKAELMAALIPPRADGSGEQEKKASDAPAVSDRRPVPESLFGHKDRRMAFLDAETHFDPSSASLTAGYFYPEDHPLVPGHFPGNPIMMGVAQWSGLADCALLLHERLGLPAGDFIADGEIMRADGTLITEIKGLEVRTGAEGSAPRALSTRRIGFRDMVRAGEEIFYRVQIRPVG